MEENNTWKIVINEEIEIDEWFQEELYHPQEAYEFVKAKLLEKLWALQTAGWIPGSLTREQAFIRDEHPVLRGERILVLMKGRFSVVKLKDACGGEV